MRAWRGTADNARATVERYRVDYVLICPNLSESTIYRSEAPQGFYMQLVREQGAAMAGAGAAAGGIALPDVAGGQIEKLRPIPSITN